MAITKGLWLPQDTLNIKRIKDLDVSPDGKWVAFTVTRAVMTLEVSSYLSQIYLTDSDGSPPRQLTSDGESSFAPRWSPDGQSIAFLSRHNIWWMPRNTGNPQQVTDVSTEVSSFTWSPDGSMIAFTALDGPTPEEVQAAREKNDPRVEDQNVKKQRLYLVSLSALPGGPSRGRPLTSGDINVGAPEVPEAYTWSPDGKMIIFAYSRSPRPNDWPSTRMACLNLEGGSVEPIGPDEAVTFNPLISPDGRWLAYKVYDNPAWDWSSVVHVLSLAGGPSRPLAETFDRRPDILGWSANGERLYFLETFGTHQRLCALPVDGNPPVVLLDAAGCIESARLNKTRSTLGFTLQSPDEPPEVYLTSLNQIDPVPMSHLNAEVRQVPIGRTEAIHWTSVDGLEIEGLLTYPTEYESGKRYPLLVSVHGGPANAWRQFFIGTQSFYGPIATFAAKGYAILRCNVRGSDGYSRAFRSGNYRDWGGKDVQDLLTGVDHVINRGVADPQCLGITGWSYGGYLTAATITQTERFKAAVIGAGITDLVSYALGNDSPDFLPSHFGGEVWEVKDLLLDRSPIVHADRVTTPTLILHGENDQRVPIWQGYEFYNALIRRGIPTQMVIYPRTGHVPSEPKLLLDVMNRILAWMEFYMKGNG